jgi:xylan 1,4-beta-xylosidase
MKKLLFVLFLLYSPQTYSQVTNPRTLPQEWGEYGIGDPYILKFRGKFYLYCSTRDDQNGVKCWSSWDLANWNYEGLCVDNIVTKAAYAPEVIYWNGTFYMYTSPAGNGHYILSASSPTGPFTVQTGNLGHSIDGSVFVDDNAQMYFTYAGGSGIQGAAMSGPLSIGSGSTLSGASLNGWTEGSTIFKRNGIYYITYTGNHVFSRGYRVNYATGTAPLGSYIAGTDNPILLNTEGTFFGLGHSGAVIGPDLDTWYIAYHNLLGQSSIVGPNRKLNIDPIGFNGNKLLVYGPTNWTQPSPLLPTFYDRFDRTTIGSNWTNVNGGNWGIYNQELMWQDNSTTLAWYRQVTTATATASYTAEFNMKEISRGGDGARFGAVFSYIDENTFGSALLSSFNNTLETDIKVNGVSIGVNAIPLPAGWDYQKWHVIRVEKEGTTFKIYVDGMLKSTRTANITSAGKIGVTTYNDHADFGYTAFSNRVNGSGVFSFYKPVPGTIPAVHYNEDGYHDLTSGNTGGKYRSDMVDIRDCEEGGENIGWNQTGEWYQYNVNVQSAGPYHLGLRYATTFTTCKLRIYCDGADVSGIVSIPATGGWSAWGTAVLKNLNLPAGNHTIRLETVEGEFDFSTLKFESGTTAAPAGADNFDSGSFSALWNYNNGNFSISAGRATSSGFAKRVMGNVGWTDYTVEADVQCPATGNGGLIFRVRNPAAEESGNSNALSSDYFQGYYAGIESSGIVLGKQNYNWTSLASKAQSLTAGQSYKLRVVLNGANIKIYLNDMTTPVINYIDPMPLISGKAGVRGHAADMIFDNFLISASTVTEVVPVKHNITMRH